MRVVPLLAFATAFLAIAALSEASPRTLDVREGDHLCLIGNTLAERMQHFNGWESLLHQRFPRHQLVVRNLAWPADEVVLRPRAEGFGEPEQHLTFSKADVVIAFFGFNEAFAGPAGLDDFKIASRRAMKKAPSAIFERAGAPGEAAEQTVPEEWKSVSRMPSAARRSISGVLLKGNWIFRGSGREGLLPGGCGPGPAGANVDGYSVLAHNVISYFGRGLSQWVWGVGHSIGPAPLQLGAKGLSTSPVLRDVIVRGNVIYDPEKDAVVADGRARVEPPRYRYAVRIELGAAAPQGLVFSTNIFDPGLDGLTTPDTVTKSR